MTSKPHKESSPGAPAIMWFRNDLRLGDNAALRAACVAGNAVVPVFIRDQEAAGQWAPGAASRWWLHHSLDALHASLVKRSNRLLLCSGTAAEQLVRIAKEVGAATVYCTRRYEPWAIRQEQDCRLLLEKEGVALKRYGGGLLAEPEAIQTKSAQPYKVYTPFWRALTQLCQPTRPDQVPDAVRAPKKWPESAELSDLALQPTRPNWAKAFTDHWRPGEAGALQRLSQFIDEAAGDYTENRNRPDLPGTSRLSPHLALGEISPRLIWYRVRAAQGENANAGGGLETFLKELAWREFSNHLLFHFPSFPEQPFRNEFAGFPWRKNEAALKAWQQGLTGYPIVDAGMRELWATGWMHNRVRMIAASFLIKDLLIPWQDGEQWFWDTLVDADLGNNAAGWQWVAGSGADAAPYFRIFNPLTQGEKFDPTGQYVRRWIPEIARLPDRILHRPFEADEETLRQAGVRLGETYPRPIVDHAEARRTALQAFATLKS